MLLSNDTTEDAAPYDENKSPPQDLFFFHLFLTLSSVYLSMILTKWHEAVIRNYSDDNNGTERYDNQQHSYGE